MAKRYKKGDSPFQIDAGRLDPETQAEEFSRSLEDQARAEKNLDNCTGRMIENMDPSKSHQNEEIIKEN